MNNDLTIEQLAQSWLDAKEEEDAAIKRRRDIGALLEAALTGPEEGSITHKGSALNVSVTRKLTRSFDTDAITAAWGEMSENAQRAIKWKAEPVLKQLRALQDLAPADYAQLSKFLTTKPASASITVERINKD